jgi:osmotically-inducible protein OsmY
VDMSAARGGLGGLLLAMMLGLAALAGRLSASAQTPASQGDTKSQLPQVVVSARREADEVLTAKVEKALKDDPYLFVPHISVTTENGIVRLEGIATDAHELTRALLLARRVAGKRRVVDDVDLWVVSEDNDK